MDVAVGVDIGSSRIKVGAYDRAGALVHLETEPTPRNDGPDGTDFPVLELVGVAERCLAAVRREVGPVLGVGIGTMGEVGTVLTDDGLADLLFPAWFDPRGRQAVDDVERRLGRRFLDGATGGHARPVSSAAKLAWLVERRVRLEGAFVGVGGALAWRLTGRAWQEASLAATSGAWDPVRVRHLGEVWDAFGLGRLTPVPVLAPGASAGASSQVAARLGVVEGAPVVVAGHDHPVAAVGAGARPGEVVDSMGTGEALLVTTHAAGLDRERVADLVARGVTVESWPTTGEPLLIHEGLRPGLAMEHFLRATGGSRAELEAHAPPPGVVRADAAAVRELEAGGRCGLAAGPDSWAAILDTYARDAASGERALREISGAAGQTVLTGGGLRSSRWLAAKAVLGEPGVAISTATETVTRGGAAMVGVRLGWWPDTGAMPGAERLTTDRTEESPA